MRGQVSQWRPRWHAVVINDLESTVSAVEADAGRTGQIGSRISTAVPATPEVGSACTDGPRPIDRLKTVP
jgi:hypothetical protein